MIDRTSWFPGENIINFLVLGVQYKSCVIPLFMSCMDKKGNSSFEERKVLIEKFIKVFGEDCVEGYLGDREFSNKRDFEYFAKKKFAFTMRLKKNILVNEKQVKDYSRGMKPGEMRVLRGKKKVLGQEVYIAIRMNEKYELMIIVTLNQLKDSRDYRLRWLIEVLFGDLKSKGFNLENTHLVDKERLKTLMQVLSIAYIYAVLAGEEENRKNPIKIKKHGYGEISIFRLGLDYLRSILLNLQECFSHFLQFLQLITLSRVLYRT